LSQELGKQQVYLENITAQVAFQLTAQFSVQTITQTGEKASFKIPTRPS